MKPFAEHFNMGHGQKIARRHRKFERFTKEEAIANKQSVYWTGKPCKHGHTDFQYVSDNSCCTCNNHVRKQKKCKTDDNKMLRIDRLLEEKEARKESSYD